MKPIGNGVGIIACVWLSLGAGEAGADTAGGRVFAGYESLEMAMNHFRYFAGEAGYRLDAKHRLRLSVVEVKLTERHLSSRWEAVAVDGENVEGYLRGYEAHFDRFFAKKWYVSGSLGYYADTYRHTQLDASVRNRTMTVGAGIGFLQRGLFGADRVFLEVSMPVRYYFHPIKGTKLGATTIRPHVVVNNLWLFVGYEF